MPKYERVDRDSLGYLLNEIKDLHERVRRLENSLTPTVPRYDVAALPSTLIDQQIFFGSDNTWNVWYSATRYKVTLT